VFNLLQLRVALLGACCLAAGCTVFPGLNLSEKAPDRHQYRVEKNADGVGYSVVNDAGRPAYEVTAISPEVIAQERAQVEQGVKQQDLDNVTPDVVPPEYRIGPGDIVSVVVWEHPELTNPIGLTQDPVSLGRLVTADGTIFYPYVGTFKVAGSTVAEVRSVIAQRLSRIIPNPQVDVRLVAFRAGRIQVSGEVNNPGIVTLDDTPKGVLEAISERNGLKPTASRRRVYLFRGGKGYEIDFASLLSGSQPGVNPELKAGDILQVPDQSGDTVFLLGEVEKQMPIVMQQDRMSLIGALTAAGGLDKLTSDDAGILVFRRPAAPGQMPRVFTLDLSDPAGLLLAGEFEVRPRDVVYVKKTGFAKYNSLIAQLVPTITAIYQLTYVDYLQRVRP